MNNSIFGVFSLGYISFDPLVWTFLQTPCKYLPLIDLVFSPTAHSVPGQREIHGSMGSCLQAAKATFGCGEILTSAWLIYEFSELTYPANDAMFLGGKGRLVIEIGLA